MRLSDKLAEYLLRRVVKRTLEQFRGATKERFSCKKVVLVDLGIEWEYAPTTSSGFKIRECITLLKRYGVHDLINTKKKGKK